MRPLLLCSNDDGVDSPLLVGLADLLGADFDVLVVAPERQRSAASHAITLHKPLRLTQVGPNRYSLSGTPADCVYVGMLRLAPRPPAMVVSGINHGYNLGTDVFYSGTVAAAAEGALRGAVGVAISMQPTSDRQAHAEAVTVAAQLVAKASKAQLRPGQILNINIPAAAPPAGERPRWTRLGKRKYADDVTERQDPFGRSYFWIGGGAVGHESIAASDCDCVAEGVISVTPLRMDITDYSAVDVPLFGL